MSSPGVDVGLIESVLRQALSPKHLEVIDDGHLHVGHGGAKSGGHYTVIIDSAEFTGLSQVQRHRLVYDALRDYMAQGIHALSIQAHAS